MFSLKLLVSLPFLLLLIFESSTLANGTDKRSLEPPQEGTSQKKVRTIKVSHTGLQEACRNGNLQEVKACLNLRSNYNILKDAQECLYDAALHNHVDLFYYFKKQGIEYSTLPDAEVWLDVAIATQSFKVAHYLIQNSVSLETVLKWPFREEKDQGMHNRLNKSSAVPFFRKNPEWITKIYEKVLAQPNHHPYANAAIQEVNKHNYSFEISNLIKKLLQPKSVQSSDRSNRDRSDPKFFSGLSRDFKKACGSGDTDTLEEVANTLASRDEGLNLRDLAWHCLVAAAERDHYRIFEKFREMGFFFESEKLSETLLLTAAKAGSSKVLDFLIAEEHVFPGPLFELTEVTNRRQGKSSFSLRDFKSNKGLAEIVYSLSDQDPYYLELAWKAIEFAGAHEPYSEVKNQIISVLKKYKISTGPLDPAFRPKRQSFDELESNLIEECKRTHPQTWKINKLLDQTEFYLNFPSENRSRFYYQAKLRQLALKERYYGEISESSDEFFEMVAGNVLDLFHKTFQLKDSNERNQTATSISCSDVSQPLSDLSTILMPTLERVTSIQKPSQESSEKEKLQNEKIESKISAQDLTPNVSHVNQITRVVSKVVRNQDDSSQGFKKNIQPTVFLGSHNHDTPDIQVKNEPDDSTLALPLTLREMKTRINLINSLLPGQIAKNNCLSCAEKVWKWLHFKQEVPEKADQSDAANPNIDLYDDLERPGRLSRAELSDEKVNKTIERPRLYVDAATGKEELAFGHGDPARFVSTPLKDLKKVLNRVQLTRLSSSQADLVGILYLPYKNTDEEGINGHFVAFYILQNKEKRKLIYILDASHEKRGRRIQSLDYYLKTNSRHFGKDALIWYDQSHFPAKFEAT